MEEVWKDIYFIENGVVWDYRGIYQVSNLGRVKSLARNHNNCRKDRILKPTKIWCGYLQVHLSKNGEKKCFLVHRIVGFMFLNNQKRKPQINHINGRKDDNRVENLEFCTNGENQIHAFKNGLQARIIGKNNPNSKKITQYDLQGNLIKIWDCMMDIERELKIDHSFISQCCKGKNKTAKGYIWRYYEEVE